MRRLLEVGEILQAGDVWLPENTPVSPHHYGFALTDADGLCFRNEPDGRAEMLEALIDIQEWVVNWDSEFLQDPAFSWEQFDAAISKAKGEVQ